MSDSSPWRKIPAYGTWSRDDAGESGIDCPSCGADTGYVHKCVECGRLDPEESDDAGDLADARDKPERFLDVSLDRGDYVYGDEEMPPRKKLQQRIRGLTSVEQVRRYIQAEISLDRPECPRGDVIEALNQRQAAIEGGAIDIHKECESGPQSDPAPDATQTPALADGGVETDDGAPTACQHPEEHVSIEQFGGDRGRWCARCCSFLEVFDDDE